MQALLPRIFDQKLRNKQHCVQKKKNQSQICSNFFKDVLSRWVQHILTREMSIETLNKNFKTSKTYSLVSLDIFVRVWFSWPSWWQIITYLLPPKSCLLQWLFHLYLLKRCFSFCLICWLFLWKHFENITCILLFGFLKKYNVHIVSAAGLSLPLSFSVKCCCKLCPHWADSCQSP